MSTENTIVRDKTFTTILSAVNKMVDLVKPTYGPASNKVIISKLPYRMVVDDGVQIARDFELPDPAENAVIQVIRETAVKTNDRVGDGTTSSLILLQAILKDIQERFQGRLDGRRISEELDMGLKEVKEKLKAAAHRVGTKEQLKKVALVSFNNELIADMISSIYSKLGEETVITIDRSDTMETVSEMSQGITMNRGYLSPYMVLDQSRMQTVLENPYILVTDYRLTEASDIVPIMSRMKEALKGELVIICDNMENSAMATAVVNGPYQNKAFFVLAVSAPQGEDKRMKLEDIALMTGAHMFTESKGDKLENATLAQLGRAKRFICRRDESIIVSPGAKKDVAKKAVNDLQEAIKAEPNEKMKKKMLDRLAFIKGEVPVIKVGASTENEQKALKYKVEDAVNAVKAAYKGGVVCGGGLSLARLKTSSPILNEALKAPARQLCRNMGIEPDDTLGPDEAFNVVTGKKGKFLDVGVVDPVDVLIAGVESAVSIAKLLVTSSGMIVEHEKEEAKH